MELTITPDTETRKKYKAVFQENGFKKTIRFGDKDYQDYTQHKNAIRKKLYLQRHKNENWNDPLTAGSLSRHILWNTPNLNNNIKLFKEKFNLT